MTDICTQCEKKYQKVAMHWSKSSQCKHPSFSNYHKEIITGILMGDGCIGRNGKNPRLICRMISPNYLNYVDQQFGIFGNGVSMCKTAKESAEHASKSGFRPNAKPENYHDIYKWSSMKHPELKKFSNWYKTGKKVWPESIELTPTVLKHWYCGDGTWNNTGTKNRIKIGMSNEVDNREKVSNLFRNVGLPQPSNYNINEYNDGGKKCDAEFTVEQSKRLWKYMGEPLPDFEYKWPDKEYYNACF